MMKRYAHWVGADVPMVSYEGDSLALAAGRWLFADHQGSIVAAAHPSGATDWVNTYDEYGIPGAGNQGRFQYTGQIWLQELGMYHYKARVYSPTLGRFLQTDPVGYEGGINLYAYVGNDVVVGHYPRFHEARKERVCAMRTSSGAGRSVRLDKQATGFQIGLVDDRPAHDPGIGLGLESDR